MTPEGKVKLLRIGGATVCVVGVAFALWQWSRLHQSRTIADLSQLEQGPIAFPTEFGTRWTSGITLNLRMNLDRMSSVASGLLEGGIPVSGTTGIVKVRDFKLRRESDRRLSVSGGVVSEGVIRVPAGPIPSVDFEIRDLDASFSGQGDLSVNEDWVLDPRLRVSAEIQRIDVRPFIPDGPAKWILNSWLIPSVGREIAKQRIPLKSLVEGPWKASEEPWRLDTPLKAEVRFQPLTATVKSPRLEEAANDVVTAIRLGFRTLATADSAPNPQSSWSAGELPELSVVEDMDEGSDVSLPLAIRISDLPVLFRGLKSPWDDGEIEIRDVELADREGTLQARVRLRILLPTSARRMTFDEVKGTVLMHLKPACDPVSGRITANEFGFSSHTNSLLIDMIGPELTRAAEAQLQQLVPTSIASAVSSFEGQIELQANQNLAKIKEEWAKQMPESAELLGSTEGKIEALRLKPRALEVKTGYLLMALQAQGKLTLQVH